MTTPPAEIPPAGELESQCAALRSAAGIAWCRDRTQIELAGRDRATFLHGFCTNDIKRLEPRQGCEAFLTNVQGKTIGFVQVFCEPDRLVIETTGGQAEHIIASLDRYLIREDVQLIDRSEASPELLVAGPAAAERLEQVLGLPLEMELYHHLRHAWQGGEMTIRRTDHVGSPGFLIRCEPSQGEACWSACVAAGAIPCSPAAVEVARIEAGTPRYGVDITDDNLPQEVDRNATAISFTKGCYLGQETVARIDALGHVNRLLRGVRFTADEVPAGGSELTHDGQPAGRVTSACWSYRLRAPLALAYVRRQWSAPGSRLDSPRGAAEVVALPLA